MNFSDLRLGHYFRCGHQRFRKVTTDRQINPQRNAVHLDGDLLGWPTIIEPDEYVVDLGTDCPIFQ